MRGGARGGRGCGGAGAARDREPRHSVAAAEAALSVLAECGGHGLDRAAAGRSRGGGAGLASAARAALAQVEARSRRGALAAGAPETAGARAAGAVRAAAHRRSATRTLPASAWRAQRAFHVLILLALRPARRVARRAARDVLARAAARGGQAQLPPHAVLHPQRAAAPPAPPLLRDAEIYRLNPTTRWRATRGSSSAELDAARRERGASRASSTWSARSRSPGRRRWPASTATGPRSSSIAIATAWWRPACRRARCDARAATLAGALDHFRRAAELDEFDESTRVSVIECQVALGNRGAAIAEYQRLRVRPQALAGRGTAARDRPRPCRRRSAAPAQGRQEPHNPNRRNRLCHSLKPGSRPRSQSPSRMRPLLGILSRGAPRTYGALLPSCAVDRRRLRAVIAGAAPRARRSRSSGTRTRTASTTASSRVHLLGFSASFEHGDTTLRQRIHGDARARRPAFTASTCAGITRPTPRIVAALALLGMPVLSRDRGGARVALASRRSRRSPRPPRCPASSASRRSPLLYPEHRDGTAAIGVRDASERVFPTFASDAPGVSRPRRRGGVPRHRHQRRRARAAIRATRRSPGAASAARLFVTRRLALADAARRHR